MEHENARTRERESWYAKKSFEKARGKAEREEEMKERGHASRDGPAGTRPALILFQAFWFAKLKIVDLAGFFCRRII